MDNDNVCKESLTAQSVEKEFIAHDSRSQEMQMIAKKAAKSQATVLLTGETGVGKEVLAHFIHTHSFCANGPFVAVNCAAIPENMLEAILFGYEKGAFTNAINSHAGKFEQAQNGTLLLDEVSEIPLTLQAKLLRALQEKEIERLCGKKPISINVRIIVATNHNLADMVAAGTFRKDLYYRLNVLPIHCLPLRERTADIVPLAEYFIRKYATLRDNGLPMLTECAKEKLSGYGWPGNIREMENIIQRVLIMTEKNQIDAEDIDITDFSNNLDQLHSKLKVNEAQFILDTLKETAGRREMAAKKLNMSTRTLRYKISKLKSIGLKVP